MIFSSMTFLSCFLLFALSMMYLCPKRYHRYMLVALSLIFYGWGEPIYVIGFCLLILINHHFGVYICRSSDKKRTIALWQGIACNLILLAYFKYYGTVLSMLFAPSDFSMPAMPLGFSFIIFTSLSFLIDLYRRQAEVTSLLDTALYISFFPKLLMGPIEPYHRFSKQIQSAVISWNMIDQGAKYFVLGLAQKVILADTFQSLHETLQSIPSSFMSSWQDALAYTFWIYFDFNGYSLMAMGLASMFGYQLMKNFDSPYHAQSIQDFWRRWHRSLSGWFRDYVYIPLGGSRVSKQRHILNLFIVWGLTGIWHGTTFNFLLWGLYYGVLLVFESYKGENYRKHVPLTLRKGITFICVVIGWVIFANPNCNQMVQQLQTMFGFGGTTLYTSEALFYGMSYLAYFLIAGICLYPSCLHGITSHKFYVTYKENLIFIGYILLFVISLCFISGSTFQSFLYVQF